MTRNSTPRADQRAIRPPKTRVEARTQLFSPLRLKGRETTSKGYSITEDGLAALRRWVTEPVEAPPRNEFVPKVYSLWLADREQAGLRARADRHAEQLAALEAARERLEREAGAALQQVDSPLFAGYATLQAGIGHARWAVDWCRWLADQPDQVLQPPPSQPQGALGSPGLEDDATRWVRDNCQPVPHELCQSPSTEANGFSGRLDGAPTPGGLDRTLYDCGGGGQ